MRVGDVNHVEKKTCLACNSVNTTTTTEACPEISKLTVVP